MDTLNIRKRDISPPDIENKYHVGYFDGATQGGDMIYGAGAMIQINRDQRFQICQNCGEGTNTHGELLVVWDLFWRAKINHITNILVLGD